MGGDVKAGERKCKNHCGPRPRAAAEVCLLPSTQAGERTAGEPEAAHLDPILLLLPLLGLIFNLNDLQLQLLLLK